MTFFARRFWQIGQKINLKRTGFLNRYDNMLHIGTSYLQKNWYKISHGELPYHTRKILLQNISSFIYLQYLLQCIWEDEYIYIFLVCINACIYLSVHRLVLLFIYLSNFVFKVLGVFFISNVVLKFLFICLQNDEKDIENFVEVSNIFLRI